MKKRTSCYTVIALIVLIGITATVNFYKPISYFFRKKSMSKQITTVKPYLFTALHYPYTLPELPYAYNALEPLIDKETMTIHHQKHHQAYIDNLNKALEGYPEYHNYTLDELLINLYNLPQALQKIVENHGGGHYNHSLFWQILSPEFDQKPSVHFTEILNTSFTSFESFREQFTKAAKGCFGSGWVWLCLNDKKELVIMTTPNQDTPVWQGLRPVIGLDVWEHAYYLKYQNRRPDYIEAWWHVLNWQRIEEVYNLALQAY